jgi:hypothetical protein
LLRYLKKIFYNSVAELRINKILFEYYLYFDFITIFAQDNKI